MAQNRTKVLAVCVSCNKEFQAVAYEIKRGKGKCCSMSCAAALSSKNRNQNGSSAKLFLVGLINQQHSSKFAVIQWKVIQPPKSWQLKALVVSMLLLKGLTAENRTATNTRGLAFTGKSMHPPRPRYVGDWKAAIVQGLTFRRDENQEGSGSTEGRAARETRVRPLITMDV